MKKLNKTLDDCTLCGLCKTNCPIFKATKLETKSARGRAILLKNKKLDDIIHQCTLCNSCKIECPEEIDLPGEIRKAREESIKKGKETQANKKMIENIRKHGNPFGRQEKGKIPKDLYCC
ncbi:MAG: (Fe-S)-binding protein [archaeon]